MDFSSDLSIMLLEDLNRLIEDTIRSKLNMWLSVSFHVNFILILIP